MVQVEGLLGAHEKSQGKASVDLIFSIRSGLVAQGFVNGQLDRSNILVYEDGGIYGIYLETGVWSQVNLRLTTNGSSTLNTNPTRETSVAGTLVYSAKNSAQFVLNYAGNVGIGTTAPAIDLAIGDTDTGLQQQGDGKLGIFTNNAERIRIQDNGNVGIGTTNPGAKLSVGMTSAATAAQVGYNTSNMVELGWNGYPYVQAQDSHTPNGYGLVLNPSGGNVGIGVTSPAARLDIAAGSGYELRFSGASSANVYAPDGDLFMLAGSGSEIHLGANETNSQIVLQNGNVGIGTTSPRGKLQIVDASTDANGTALTLGPIEGSNLRLGYDNEFSWIQSHGGKPLAINSLGNKVGIGTTAPTQTLDVNGGLRVRGGVSCGALVEENLQTPQELAAGEINRFEEGDVLCWGIDQLELCATANDRLVQAVADGQGRPIVIGAEKVKVLGPVQRGDILVASDVAGYAVVNNDPISGSVIAQALEDFDEELGVVKAMIRKW